MTKEEILKKYTDEFDQYLDGDCEYLGNPCLSAMEEYAKQEALGFYEWKKNYEWEFDFRQEECPLSDDELWNEYQKSKVK